MSLVSFSPIKVKGKRPRPYSTEKSPYPWRTALKEAVEQRPQVDLALVPLGATFAVTLHFSLMLNPKNISELADTDNLAKAAIDTLFYAPGRPGIPEEQRAPTGALFPG